MDTETLDALPEAAMGMSAGQSAGQSQDSRDVLDERILADKKIGLSIRALALKYARPKSWVERSLNRSLKKFAKETGMVGASVKREEIIQRIFNNAPVAVEKVIGLMEGAEKEEVQLKAAESILSRAGFDPVQRHVNLTIVEEMSREELIEHINRLLSNDIRSTKNELIVELTQDQVDNQFSNQLNNQVVDQLDNQSSNQPSNQTNNLTNNHPIPATSAPTLEQGAHDLQAIKCAPSALEQLEQRQLELPL